jgi:hypothetical protein
MYIQIYILYINIYISIGTESDALPSPILSTASNSKSANDPLIECIDGGNAKISITDSSVDVHSNVDEKSIDNGDLNIDKNAPSSFTPSSSSPSLVYSTCSLEENQVDIFLD